MPGVADRHVHIRLSDPARCSSVGSPPCATWRGTHEIFALAGASEMPTFTGPLIRAVGPMLTAPGGYPTGDGWAPDGAIRSFGPRGRGRGRGRARGRGAAAIKVALNAEAGPTPPDQELSSIVEARTNAACR